MARGAEAKKLVVNKIKEIFGDDYVGEFSSKHYVWSKENGEKLQIAISLTCPKNPVGEIDMGSAFGDGMDFEATPIVAETTFVPAEITPEEEENLANMMARLGL